MSTLLVAVFDDEADARGGAQILRSLHDDGVLTLYALAIVGREAHGAGLVPWMPVGAGKAIAAPAVGAAVGALVSLLGVLSAATRTLTSGLVSAVRDLDEIGLAARFLEEVSCNLKPGGGALVAEADEYRQLPVDTRVAARGGLLFRNPLAGELSEDRVVRRIGILRGEIVQLRSEGEQDGLMPAAQVALRSRALALERAFCRAQGLAFALRREGAAKVAVLRRQAVQLQGSAQIAVMDRAVSVKASVEARAARLDRIWEGADRRCPSRGAPTAPAGPGRKGKV